MSNCKILALPVDGRPVTREQVQMLARIADCELLCPPVNALGHFRRPADRGSLVEWIARYAGEVQGFIISLDMLVYGGLVPSRFIDDEFESLSVRLKLLEDLKRQYPDKPLYGFCATMRISNNNENEEEKLYWAEYGTDLWAWSFHSDRFECKGNRQDRERAEAFRNRIPESVRRDYLDTRARNFAITLRALELVEQGVFDRLILPQDDTAEYGFNIAERRRLQQIVVERGLSDQVRIFPGADEVVYTLLAHQLQRLGWLEPIRVALVLHHPEALGRMVARYEDRPVLESIHCQVQAAGTELVVDPQSADVLIAVNCRGPVQGDWAMQYPLEEDLGIDPQWLEKIQMILLRAEKPLALLDLAYANGGDPELLVELESAAGLQNLCAYSGWNTASNSIGSLVAQLCAVAGYSVADAKGRHNRHLLATRLLDDYLYQARFRQTLRAQQSETQTSDGDPAALETLYLPMAQQWLRAHRFADVSLESVYFPWSRSFEVGLHTALKPSAAGRRER
ncbi:DUF4127 family protein [Microbulbifer sp. TYP-18]|uniref:DUF4127 family protein n=1 Tax=Microbulbifer sp. TYP-18 TaxID=3230024 RepID=UPI0034C661BC